MKHPLTCVLAAALAVVVSGCAKPTAPVAKNGPVPAGAFVQAWHADVDLDGKPARALTLDGGRLFVTSTNNVIVSLSTAGSVTARMDIAEPIEKIRNPIVQGDQVIVPTSSTIEVFKANGLRDQSIPLESPVRGNAVASGKEVYLAVDGKGGNGRISKVGLDKNFPYVRWELLTGLVASTPFSHEGILYVATEAGTVYALTPERQNFWPASAGLPDGLFHAKDRVVADLFVDDSGVYVPSLDGVLYVLDPVNGRIRWRFTAGTPLDQKPVVTADAAYLYVADRGLCAFDKTGPALDRAPRWANPAARMVLNEDKDNVYVATTDNRFAALDKKTGAAKFMSTSRDFKFFVTHLDPKDPTLYAATAKGRVVAVTPILKAGTEGLLVFAQ